MPYVFPPAAVASVAVAGRSQRFPVHRIYCVGRNYAEHAVEMGAKVDRVTPTFFCKPADAVLEDATKMAYPIATSNLHHEVELVVALHSGGTNISIDDAPNHVFGYAVGLDLTRRDLQLAAKAKGDPWDTAKAFDRSAPISTLRAVTQIGHPVRGRISLDVNGDRRQQADIGEMIFGVNAIVHELSKLFELKAGDLIFTGTPAGVGALVPGDRFHARIEGIGELRGRMA
jgi:fumarylpyruvate hydrolase